MDFSYINKDGKKVNGSAAFVNAVYTRCGGMEKYNDLVGEAYLKRWISDNRQSVNQSVERTIKKKSFTAM